MASGNTSQGLHRQVIDAMVEPMAVIDGALRIRLANLAFARICGRAEADIGGAPMFGAVLAVSAQERLRSLLVDAAAAGRTLDRVPIEARLSTGRRSLILSARPLGGDGGEDCEAPTMLLTFRDNHWARTTSAADTVDNTNKQVVEINHRVKNNLGSILAMLRLEGRSAADPATRALLGRVAMRVQAIASLYEVLSVERRNGVVGLVRYLKTIARSIEQVAGGGRGGWTIDVQGSDFDVSVDDAARYGAVVNELVSNAAKYAFADGASSGSVSIRCERKGEMVEVEVADDGSGISVDGTQAPSTGLGIRLVELYLNALEGQMERSTAPGRGTVCTLRMPYRPATESAGPPAATATVRRAHPVAGRGLHRAPSAGAGANGAMPGS